MSDSQFKRALEVLFPIEGGYSNRPLRDDPGGPTMLGVTQKTYDAYRVSKRLPPRPVRLITEAEAVEIYRTEYWDKVRASSLPVGLDLAVFDFAVNSGPAQAVRDLQREIGVAVDGIAGNITVSTARSIPDIPALIDRYQDRRWRYMQGLNNFQANKNGWRKRVEHIRATGKAWANETLPPKPAVVTDTPKADPADVDKTKDPAVQGIGMAGLGTLVEVVNQSAAALFGFASENPVVTYAAVALIMLGIIITAYRLTRSDEAVT